MKNYVLLFLFILWRLALFGQDDGSNSIKGLYYFNKTIPKVESKKMIADTSSTAYQIKARHIVEVLETDCNEIRFRYINFKNDSLSEIYNNKTYSLTKSEFSNLTKTYFNRWRKWKVGTYTVPIRIRSSGENFEFESNLSLGANLIKGFNLSRYRDDFYVDGSLGISLTKVNLTGDNSSVKSINPDLEKLSQGALTFSLGLAVHLLKNVNAGFFYGWDFLDGKEQSKLKWQHNAKPWIGFGINLNFSEGSASNDNSKSYQN